MIERLNAHLSDESLNEYLDQALAASARAAAAAHLANCAACAARLQTLTAVFSELADLPPAPLARDLRTGVLAAVRAQPPTQLRPIADPRRPAFKIIFGLQLLAAAALIGFAWPAVASLAHLAPDPGGAWNPAAVSASWTASLAASGSLWPAMQAGLASLTAPTAWPLTDFLQPAVAGLVLAAAGLLWLLGNALFLRPRAAPWLRRHS